MITHETRLESYDLSRPEASTRRKQIYGYLKENGSQTAEEIMDGIGFFEPNQVRPRLTELRGLGLVRCTGKRRSHRTGKNTAVWEAITYD